jgi:hypothetical protein
MSVSDRDGIAHSLRHAPAVIGGASRRRDGFAVLLTSTLGYLAIYLWAVGDLAFRTDADTGLFVVDQPLARMFEQAPGTFSYEPIMLVKFGVGTFLFSPIDATLGLLLAVLVGFNMALSYLAIVQPQSCGIGAGSGVLASIPALLAGSACCAPVLLIVLGITASGTLLAVLPWLLPLGVVLLVASLLYLAGQINPEVLAA